MLDFRLCNRLKVARAEKSLSQEQLAMLAGNASNDQFD